MSGKDAVKEKFRSRKERSLAVVLAGGLEQLCQRIVLAPFSASLQHVAETAHAQYVRAAVAAVLKLSPQVGYVDLPQVLRLAGIEPGEGPHSQPAAEA